MTPCRVAPPLRALFASLALALAGCQAGPTAPTAAGRGQPIAARVGLATAPALLLSQPEPGCDGTGQVTHVWRYRLTIRNDEPVPVRLVSLVRLRDASAYGGVRHVDRLEAAELAAALGTGALAPGDEASLGQCIEAGGASDVHYTVMDARGRVATSMPTTLHPGYSIDAFPRP